MIHTDCYLWAIKIKCLRTFTFLAIALQFICIAAWCQPTKIYLSPKAAGSANQSMFIDSVRFYPLEKSNGADISRYSGLYITDQYFIVVNYQDGNLIVYDRNGRLVKQVAYKKKGADSYPRYDKAKQQLNFIFTNKLYSLTEKDRIEIQTDFANKKNKKYYKKYIIDLNDSTFTMKKATVTAFDILDAYNLKDDLYCTYRVHVSDRYKDTTDYEVKIYKNDQFVKGYFPYNKNHESKYLYAPYIGAHTQESGKPDTFYITRPYLDTIYSLSNDIITPAYQIVLPMENSLPKSFFETPFKNKTERENFERNNGWMLRQIYTVFESGRYMFITIGFLSNYGQYIYDKKTTSSYNLSKTKADSITYNLPIISDDPGNRFNNKYYRVINAETLKKAYELKDKSIPFPKELEACFKDSKNPTPVIVEYTIKTY